jgi:N-acyl-D-aspartate/D-glutamate deacylase
MGSDSGARGEDGIYSKEKSHPRAWGSASRILGHYVRDEKLLPLEEAIRKMTSLPASRMGLADQGILRPGMAADVVAFDPATVRDRSTYADPITTAKGCRSLWSTGGSSWMPATSRRNGRGGRYWDPVIEREVDREHGENPVARLGRR